MTSPLYVRIANALEDAPYEMYGIDFPDLTEPMDPAFFALWVSDLVVSIADWIARGQPPVPSRIITAGPARPAAHTHRLPAGPAPELPPEHARSESPSQPLPGDLPEEYVDLPLWS
jgi:hypothetical protein